VRAALEVRAGKPDLLEQGYELVIRDPAPVLVRPKRLGDKVTDGETRVQGSNRVLEDDLQVPA
jgi:hypothetical protein